MEHTAQTLSSLRPAYPNGRLYKDTESRFFEYIGDPSFTDAHKHYYNYDRLTQHNRFFYMAGVIARIDQELPHIKASYDKWVGQEARIFAAIDRPLSAHTVQLKHLSLELVSR